MMRKQNRLLLALMLAAGLLGLQGCGGGVTTPGLTVTISPPSAKVPVNQTADFTATVTNATNANVTWEVNGMPGGSSSTGKIAPAPGNNNIAVYTAPAMLPAPPTVTVTAVSQQDNSTTSNSATVTITVAAAGVSVSPNPADVPAGGIQSFTASVNGQATTATWSVSCQAPQTSACGTIDPASGSYTAPLSPPPGDAVTITATTASGSGTATATIRFSGASFNGQYAFTFTGSDLNGAPLDVAGSFAATGSANSTTVNVASGVMDIDSGSLGVITGSPITSGTFNIGAADGRSSGTITASTPVGAVTFKLQLTLISNQHALLVDFDTSDTGSGTIDLQNQTEFLVSKISGNYAFGVAGADIIGLSLNVAGKFFADGSGGIPGGSNQAVLDVNDGGIVTQADTSLSGSYGSGGIDATTGRGIVQLTSNFIGTLTFAFYIVDHTHLKVIEIDAPPSPILDGDVFSAPATSPGAYTLATLARGNYAFTVGGSNRGSSSIEPFVQGGVLDSDGGGNITGGIMDVNDTHNQTTHSIQPTTYTVDPTFGRIALVISNGNPFNFAAYATSTGSVVLIGLNGNPVSSGLAFLQAASGVTRLGSFALNVSGVAFSGSFSFEQDTVGQIALAGTSVSGNLDINSALDGIPPATFALTTSSLSAPDANGRGTATLQAPNISKFNLAYYVVNNNTLLLLDLDSNRVALGVASRQF